MTATTDGHEKLFLQPQLYPACLPLSTVVVCHISPAVREADCSGAGWNIPTASSVPAYWEASGRVLKSMKAGNFEPSESAAGISLKSMSEERRVRPLGFAA